MSNIIFKTPQNPGDEPDVAELIDGEIGVNNDRGRILFTKDRIGTPEIVELSIRASTDFTSKVVGPVRRFLPPRTWSVTTCGP